MKPEEVKRHEFKSTKLDEAFKLKYSERLQNALRKIK